MIFAFVSSCSTVNISFDLIKTSFIDYRIYEIAEILYRADFQ